MAESPIMALLNAVDALDVEASTALFADDGRLLTSYGRVAQGSGQVRAAMSELLSELRRTTHTVTAEWHPEQNVWIAEVDATYELTDYTMLGPFARAFILRDGPHGVVEMRVYGLHEQPLPELTRHYQEVYGSGHWLPTL